MPCKHTETSVYQEHKNKFMVQIQTKAEIQTLTFLKPLNGRSMGRLKRLLIKSWKAENMCFISSSDTLKPSSTLTAMVNDSFWLSLWNDILTYFQFIHGQTVLFSL